MVKLTPPPGVVNLPGGCLNNIPGWLTAIRHGVSRKAARLAKKGFWFAAVGHNSDVSHAELAERAEKAFGLRSSSPR